MPLLVASHSAYSTERPAEFKLCHQTLIPLSLLLFLCDLAALEMDWANREGARERMDRNKRGF